MWIRRFGVNKHPPWALEAANAYRHAGVKRRIDIPICERKNTSDSSGEVSSWTFDKKSSTNLFSWVLVRYSRSISPSMRFLMVMGPGANRWWSCSTTSATNCACGIFLRAFMMRTIAASISCFRSSSTLARVSTRSCSWSFLPGTMRKKANQINQSINHSINQSLNQTINQSINRSITQTLSRMLKQSINRSKGCLIKRSYSIDQTSYNVILQILHLYVTKNQLPLTCLNFHPMITRRKGFVDNKTCVIICMKKKSKEKKQNV